MRRPPRKEDGNLTAYRDGEVTLRSNRRLDGYTEADKEIGYQGIRVGDLVIHAMDAFAGAIGVSDSDGKSSPVYLACQPLPGHDARYFARVMRHIALSGYITSLGKGVRERSTDFRWSDARNVLVPVPPIEEQLRILAFLDRETGQIDALITTQEQLVETLTERRQAVITQAVTRGLDPSVEFKDSGIDWLGKCPVHWKLGRVGNSASLTLGKMLQAQGDQAGSLRPYLRAGNIQENGVDIAEVKQMVFTEAEARSLTLKQGDVVVVEGGAGYGRSDVLSQDLTGWGFQNHVIRVRLFDGNDSSYFNYLVKAIRASGHIEAIGSFATIPNVSSDKLSRIRYAIPLLQEQQAISKHLDLETTRIDTLTAKASQVVEALKERRQALISAPVTGKIDVRGL